MTGEASQQPQQDLEAAASAEQLLAAALSERDALAARLQEMNATVAEMRARPMRVFSDLLRFHVLNRLSRMSPPLPWTMASRFARSAKKRDPYRTFKDFGAEPNASGRCLAGQASADMTRPDILIVSHEASRTGAPILALNLAEHLGQRYNVTLLSLRSGPCVPDFAAVSTEVFLGDAFPIDRPDGLVEKICAGRQFAFAIVNSAESVGTLAALKRAGVPTVVLLHEFANLYPVQRRDTMFATVPDETVFSAQVTRDAARDVWKVLNDASVHVVAQGKCRVPTPEVRPDSIGESRSLLEARLRPPMERPFVVIGAGTVNLRKGVDLFIETARRVLANPDGRHARFFWIGGGFDPLHDTRYSVYVADQIARSGLADRVTMLPETPFIEAAYASADVLLVPSRLDPLPNVGIDAMSAALPVLCFDRATGLAEQLDAAGLREHCVADYLDCGDMARKVLALARDAALCGEIRSRLRSYSATHLDFGLYAARIEALGLGAAARVPGRAA